MRLPDDVFPLPADYFFYANSQRVKLFMAETDLLGRDVVVACLLKNIDTANDEIARLKGFVAEEN